MSWLLFLDESGHDHRHLPYEVHGGFAIHASKLWLFISAVKTLEQSMFGTYLHQYDSELKGAKLLDKKRFQWASQGPAMEIESRRKHALNFLNNNRQGRKPRRDEFTAFGQASLAMAEGVIQSLQSHDAMIFAAAIPRVRRPTGVPAELLRKDIVFLLERFFYFLEGKREMGLLVMDGTDKESDRNLTRRMERYCTETLIGRQRTKWIVPVPLFVESDMVYGVQVADLCIYCLNWACRLKDMIEPTRAEIVPFVSMLEKVVWHGDGHRDGKVFKTHGIVFVPDPYTARSGAKKKEETTRSGPP